MADISRLPGPLSDRWDWQYQGLCTTMDTNQFFHPEGERGGPRRRRAAAAKAICAQCPVMNECRAHALETAEPYGIWGGMSEEERHSYLVATRSRSA